MLCSGAFSVPSPCPRVDTPPQSLSSSLQKTQYENTAILLIIKEGGGRVSLDGVAARGLVNGTRDAVVGGMKSELVPTEPSQTYPVATVVMSI